MELRDGPFSHLVGEWNFRPVGDGSQRVQVELTLSFRFDSLALSKLVSPVLTRLRQTWWDAFVKRAEQVYGT